MGERLDMNIRSEITAWEAKNLPRGSLTLQQMAEEVANMKAKHMGNFLLAIAADATLFAICIAVEGEVFTMMGAKADAPVCILVFLCFLGCALCVREWLRQSHEVMMSAARRYDEASAKMELDLKLKIRENEE